MKKMTMTVKESGFNIRDSKSMILNVINNQINNYKLQFIVDWERNHNISTVEKDHKIKELESNKKDLLTYFKDYESDHEEVSFTLSLEVKLTNKLHLSTSEE